MDDIFTAITVEGQIVYFEKVLQGNLTYYQTVDNPSTFSGFLYTLASAKDLTETNNGEIRLKDSFFFQPEIISQTDIHSRNLTVHGTAVPLVGGIGINLSGGFIEIYINTDKLISIVFSGANPISFESIASQINSAAASINGSGYNQIAIAKTLSGTVPNSIILRTPSSTNARIVIKANVNNLLIFGTSASTTDDIILVGDIPYEYDYNAIINGTDVDYFIVMQETYAPNSPFVLSGAVAISNKFIPVIRTNMAMIYFSEFDKGLIENNPRLQLMIDGYAYIVDMLDREIGTFLDKVNIDKIPQEFFRYISFLLGYDIGNFPGTEDATRDFIKNLIQMYRIKGTKNSFQVLFKFIGFIVNAMERYPNAPIYTFENFIITNSIINDYYNKFLNKDSIQRNQDQVIDAGITPYYYFNQYNFIYVDSTALDASNGISFDKFNKLKILQNFNVRVEDVGNALCRAYIQGAIIEPFDLSFPNNTLSIIVDNGISRVDIDFLDYLSYFDNIYSAKAEEVRSALSVAATLVDSELTVEVMPDQSIMLRSNIQGSDSSLQIPAGADNISLGFFTGSSVVTNAATHIAVISTIPAPSQTNVTVEPTIAILIPEVEIKNPLSKAIFAANGDYFLYVQKVDTFKWPMPSTDSYTYSAGVITYTAGTGLIGSVGDIFIDAEGNQFLINAIVVSPNVNITVGTRTPVTAGTHTNSGFILDRTTGDNGILMATATVPFAGCDLDPINGLYIETGFNPVISTLLAKITVISTGNYTMETEKSKDDFVPLPVGELNDLQEFAIYSYMRCSYNIGFPPYTAPTYPGNITQTGTTTPGGAATYSYRQILDIPVTYTSVLPNPPPTAPGQEQGYSIFAALKGSMYIPMALTTELQKQITEFIEFLRPVHVAGMYMLLTIPEEPDEYTTLMEGVSKKWWYGYEEPAGTTHIPGRFSIPSLTPDIYSDISNDENTLVKHSWEAEVNFSRFDSIKCNVPEEPKLSINDTERYYDTERYWAEKVMGEAAYLQTGPRWIFIGESLSYDNSIAHTAFTLIDSTIQYASPVNLLSVIVGDYFIDANGNKFYITGISNTNAITINTSYLFNNSTGASPSGNNYLLDYSGSIGRPLSFTYNNITGEVTYAILHPSLTKVSIGDYFIDGSGKKHLIIDVSNIVNHKITVEKPPSYSNVVTFGNYINAGWIESADYNRYLNIADLVNTYPFPTGYDWTPTSIVAVPAARKWPFFYTWINLTNELFVWGGENGGFLNTGGRYNPDTDTWVATSLAGVPAARWGISCVFADTAITPVVIVWGGQNPVPLNSGSRYNPITDIWNATVLLNAPSTRHLESAIWTSSGMLIWGGWTGAVYRNDGGLYNPDTDVWNIGIGTANLRSGASPNNPSGRYGHSAIWTGSKLVVWGGMTAAGATNTGGVYDFATDTWTATSLVNAPSARYYASSIWTGKYMIVIGGYPLGIKVDGGIYDPDTDTWIVVSTTNAPIARGGLDIIWEGTNAIVWGGNNGGTYYQTGKMYILAANDWIDIPITGTTPTARYEYCAVWNGNKMIIWGGQETGGITINTGGVYKSTTITNRYSYPFKYEQLTGNLHGTFGEDYSTGSELMTMGISGSPIYHGWTYIPENDGTCVNPTMPTNNPNSWILDRSCTSNLPTAYLNGGTINGMDRATFGELSTNWQVTNPTNIKWSYNFTTGLISYVAHIDFTAVVIGANGDYFVDSNGTGFKILAKDIVNHTLTIATGVSVRTSGSYIYSGYIQKNDGRTASIISILNYPVLSPREWQPLEINVSITRALFVGNLLAAELQYIRMPVSSWNPDTDHDWSLLMWVKTRNLGAATAGTHGCRYDAIVENQWYELFGWGAGGALASFNLGAHGLILTDDGITSWNTGDIYDISDTFWHQLVLTFKIADRKARVYVDSVLIDTSGAFPAGRTFCDPAITERTIGKNQSSWIVPPPPVIGASYNAGYFSNATFDEVRFYWNRELTGPEIITDYATGHGTYGSATEVGLTIGYHLDEVTGTNCDNYQGNAALDATTYWDWNDGMGNWIIGGILAVPQWQGGIVFAPLITDYYILASKDAITNNNFYVTNLYLNVGGIPDKGNVAAQDWADKQPGGTYYLG